MPHFHQKKAEVVHQFRKENGEQNDHSAFALFPDLDSLIPSGYTSPLPLPSWGTIHGKIVAETILSTPETSPSQSSREPTAEQPNSLIPAANEGATVAVAQAPSSFPVFGLRDVLLVVAVCVAALLFCAVGLGIAMAAVPALKHTKPDQLSANVSVVLGFQLTTYAITFAFIYRLLVHHYQTPFLEAVGWRWPARWWRFVVGGLAISSGVLLSMRYLPVPKEVPIDQFFRTPLAAWLMTIFGVVIAPFVEELFFRGMLFPALARRTGVLLAMIVTATGFAMIHADQLGKNWALVLAIFGVGLVFTLIRHISGSLAASVLSHMSYNGLIFAVAFAQTGGFRHMERMAR